MPAIHWFQDMLASSLWVEDGDDTIIVHIPLQGGTYDELMKEGQAIFDKYGITVLPSSDENLLSVPLSNSERN